MWACQGEDQYEQYCHIDIFCATRVNSIRCLCYTDAHSMARWCHSYIYLYLLLYLYIMSSPVQNCCHLSSFVSFILVTCLCNLLPLLFMVLVILPLLMWSCLYSQHNWRKCCCLDRIDTSIVSHQSSLEMSLLWDDFSSMKRKRRKGMGLWRKGWMNYPSFKVTDQIRKQSRNIHVEASCCLCVHI